MEASQRRKEFEAVLSRIESASKVLVTTHDRPDGDAIGSAVALGLMLEVVGKEVQIVNADGVPERLEFLSDSSRVQLPEGQFEGDLVVALDSAGRDRIGETVWTMIRSEIEVVNIDHHISNTRFGTQNLIDSAAPATGQIVFQLAEEAGWEVSQAVAENLYAAISTDTGSFCYPSTTAETYRIAGELVRCGVDVGELSRQLYGNYPKRRIELMRHLLSTMLFGLGDRFGSMELTQETAKGLSLKTGDTEGMIDLIRGIDSVVVAVLFEEMTDGKIRVSARSKDESFSVGELCGMFGGGGHTLAAGARMKGPIDQAKERVFAEVERLLQSS
ncbi:MAG: bifunctional oligoribonuclease/PAP phosphatase NrnA [Verrucomicrobiota bacterium]